MIISQFEANHIYFKNLQEGFKKHFNGIRVILSSRKPERNKKSTTSILRPLRGRLAELRDQSCNVSYWEFVYKQLWFLVRFCIFAQFVLYHHSSR